MQIYPEYKDRVELEISSLNNNFCIQNLNKLQFLEACIKETLRHYGPTTTILPKVAIKDHYLGNIRVKKGTLVSLASTELHYDAKYYNNPF